MTTAIYCHTDCLAHEMGSWHPESPARLQAIEDQLIASRIDTCIDHREAPLADLAAIARVHRADAIARVRDNLPPPGDCYWLDAAAVAGEALPSVMRKVVEAASGQPARRQTRRART